jgi:peptide/nickel transport system permease protein
VPDSDVEEEGTPAVALDAAPVAPAARRAPFGVFFWLCVGWMALLVVAATFASVLPFWDPNANDFVGAGIDGHLSWSHPFGTDHLARDILSQVAYGARVSLVIGVTATAIGISIGGFLGMASAYLRGRVDAFLTLVMYSGLAFPAIIAVIAILSFWGRNELHVIVVLGLFSVPLIYRVVRAATLASATKEYVTAARSQGATSLWVIRRDIFPNVAPTLLSYTVFTMGAIIATEGALAFLGFSVQSPQSSWGTVISDASNDPSNLGLLFAPAITLFLTLVSLYYIGERFRVRFETQESRL